MQNDIKKLKEYIQLLEKSAILLGKASLKVQTENIPQQLKDEYRQNWAVWKFDKPHKQAIGANFLTWIDENRPITKKDLSKVPYGRGQSRISTGNPQQWRTYGDAEAALLLTNNKFAGLALRISGELVAIDLDNCVHNGEIAPWAWNIAWRVNSYTEFSPSGKGLRIFCSAVDNRCRQFKKGELEIYTANTRRYVTVTGQRLNDFPAVVLDCTEEVEQLQEDTFGAGGAGVEWISDYEPDGIPTDEKFQLLHSGNWQAVRLPNGGQKYPSQSEADQAYCSILAYRGYFPGEVDAMLRSSGLMRAKWESREDYRRYVLNLAFRDVGQLQKEIQLIRKAAYELKKVK